MTLMNLLSLSDDVADAVDVSTVSVTNESHGSPMLAGHYVEAGTKNNNPPSSHTHTQSMSRRLKIITSCFVCKKEKKNLCAFFFSYFFFLLLLLALLLLFFLLN